MPTILVIEDESRLAEILLDYLKREGYKTEYAKDGARALELWRSAKPNLLLLDLMMPEIDGLEVARRVRTESDVPIIMLTARDEEVDKLVGLGIGADDYVVKPYSPREVVARVKAVLRRANGVQTPQNYRVGQLNIDMNAFEVRCNDVLLPLTASEVRLLALLAKENGRVFQRIELIEALGSPGRFIDERSVDAHIKNLRKKLGDCSQQLETVRGVGYRLKGN